MDPNFQQEWDTATGLSELDMATIGASAHLPKLRAIKATGGKAQTDMRGAMVSIFDSTVLDEHEIERGLLAALESTPQEGEKLLTEVDTHNTRRITVAEAIRDLMIARVFNRYALHNIGAISDTDTTQALANSRNRTLIANFVHEARRTRANNEITSLIGRLRELEDDPDLSGVDPHIVLVIARKELEVLRVMETAYTEGKSSLDSRRMVKRVQEVTRPKLQALIAEMESKVGPIIIPKEPKNRKTAPPTGKRSKEKRENGQPRTPLKKYLNPKKLALAVLGILAGLGAGELISVASKYVYEKWTTAETDTIEIITPPDTLDGNSPENVKTDNYNPSKEEDDDSAY